MFGLMALALAAAAISAAFTTGRGGRAWWARRGAAAGAYLASDRGGGLYRRDPPAVRRRGRGRPAARCPGCRAAMIARVRLPRPPAPDGPGGGPFREHVAEWAGARPGSLLLSLGEYHRTGDISPVRGFKSPLGHCRNTNAAEPRSGLRPVVGLGDRSALGPTAGRPLLCRRGRRLAGLARCRRACPRWS